MRWLVGFFEADVMQHFHVGKVGFPKLFGGCFLFIRFLVDVAINERWHEHTVIFDFWIRSLIVG